MFKYFLAAILGLTSVNAFAQCYGSATYYNCYDLNSGNDYTVQKIGNTTYVDGYNSGTGNRWSQESSTYGNITYTNGTAANGNSWDMTTQTIGNTRFIDGTDSRGNSFSKICNQFGCY